MLTQVRVTSVNALLYALRELGRRAGAGAREVRRWRVAVEADRTVLFPDPNSQRRIVFPVDRSKPERIGALCAHEPSRYEPDIVVPFEERTAGGPLFVACAPDEIECRGDILTATLWTLARVEERGAGTLDEHGRFRAAASIAARCECLERPIVDEYGLAFGQALTALMPGWKPAPRCLRVKLSHDIDRIGYPRRLRSTGALLLRYRNLPAFVRELISFTGAARPAYLEAVLQTAAISAQRRLDSAFYFKAALRTTQWDTGYDLLQPPIRRVIEHLVEGGCEIGLHPGYDTFHSQTMLDAEVSHLRGLVGGVPIGGRQHYLRWDCSTWLAWERAGLAYDSTLGYAEAMGFRAGTSIPYHPWSIEEDRELALLEVPLIVMDCTPIDYMRLEPERALARISAIVERTAAVGGVFTLLWHNASVIEPPYAKLYPRILDLLGAAQNYDWRSEGELPPLPLLTHGAS
ncbi:MAG TPA: polysaccharide deacetylase family protein [Candidatus Baltobacteraceae bacterium]|nr:polysaccharide deacetylase family protein [Candidatus Baltobacteraceae bacterium]